MDLPTAISDNVTELLAKILDFIERRRMIITQNIISVGKKGFVPMDLDAEQFAELMAKAISEHLCSGRLLLCDGDNIQFGENGSFQSQPIVDVEAKKLFENDVKNYVELQVSKLSENLLNKKVAIELLKRRKAHFSAAINQ